MTLVFPISVALVGFAVAVVASSVLLAFGFFALVVARSLSLKKFLLVGNDMADSHEDVRPELMRLAVKVG